MHPIPPHILLLLLAFPSLVVAADFFQCIGDFNHLSNATGGVDPQGRPVSPELAVGLTYEACVGHCGRGPDTSGANMSIFSLSAWLLPWLVLVTRLPFGSANYRDDFVSGWLFFFLRHRFLCLPWYALKHD